MPNPLLSTLGILDEETSQETVYDLKDAQARSDISTINGKIPSAASSSNQLVDTSAMNTAIGTAVSSAYKHAGTKTVAELTSALLVAANKGNVYNMTDSGYTTADFLEGAGKPIDIGDNVGICEPTSGTFKFDLLSGFKDTSSLQPKTLDTPITVDGTQKTTVEGALGAINTLAAGCKTAIGTLSSLTTTVKTNIVAAINELVTSVSTINGKIPSGASSSNKMATASDVASRVDWSSYAKTGVHNLFPIDIATVKSLNTDGTWTGNSYAKNGLTYACTVSGNQVTNVAVSGTASGNTDLILYRTNLGGAFVGKNVTMNGCPNGGGISSYYLNGYRLASVDGSSGSVQDTGNGITFDFLNNDSGTRGWIGISVASGANIATAVNFNPMIRLSSDSNPTFVPYAMTNRQLTEILPITPTADGTIIKEITNNNCYVIPSKKLAIINMTLKVGTYAAWSTAVSGLPTNKAGAISPVFCFNQSNATIFGGVISAGGNFQMSAATSLIPAEDALVSINAVYNYVSLS